MFRDRERSIERFATSMLEAQARQEQPQEQAGLPLPAPFGRYRLTQLLAVGGMAEIYLANSFGAEGFVKPLVIKRLDPQLANDPYYTNLFINEAKLLVTLNHGNIVPVFDFGKVGEDLYIAMEHIPGLSLYELLRALRSSGATLDPLLAAYIAAEICKGLDYAHRKTDDEGRTAGVIHRDIKPTNVLLSFEGEVKIVDFGVAKLATLQTAGQLIGTLSYMSPEQANRQAVDAQTDIFSTGLVLYEMLCGDRPYRARDAAAMLAQARHARFDPPPDAIARELREVVRHATELEPNKRYAAAHEMERDLTEYLLLVRSAGAEMESTSPASKLASLLKQIARASGTGADASAHHAPTASLPAGDDLTSGVDPSQESQPSISLLHTGGTVDLELINKAAETFQGRFLTRVLEEQQPQLPRRWWTLLAAGAVVVAGLSFAAVWLLGGSRGEGHAEPAPRAGTKLSDRGEVVEKHTAGTAARPSKPAVAGDPDGAVGNGALRADSALPSPSGPDTGRRTARTEPSRDRRRRARRRKANRRRHHRRRSRQRHPHRARRAATSGYLNLNSIPWSRVAIDGKQLKRPTPLLKLRLSAGVHTIALRNRERRLHKVIRVRIRPGRTTWKVVRF